MEKQVGPLAYKLRLPKSMCRLHPVFNVVKLTPAPTDPIPGRRITPPADPIIEEGEEEWEVEEVLDSRLRYRKLQYFIKWKGFGIDANSWENAADVFAPELIANFHRTHPGAPRQIRQVDFGLIPFRELPQTVTPSRRNLEGGVDVRGHPNPLPPSHSLDPQPPLQLLSRCQSLLPAFHTPPPDPRIPALLTPP